jgi:hypothetical protein
VASEGRTGLFLTKGAHPQPRLDAERIIELERKVGQQTMELDFSKKACLLAVF